MTAFGALTLLVGQKEGHSACIKLKKCCYAGSDDLIEALCPNVLCRVGC